MALGRDNKSRIIFSPKFLALCFILLALCILFWMLYPNKASSGPYLDSAHGNSYGVLRTSLSTPPNNYGQGNCAHCHEQHASIGGAEPAPNTGNAAGPDKYELFQALFVDQGTTFCYGCHKDPGVSNQKIPMPNQYNYSHIAGGDINTCPDDIKEAFQFVSTTGWPQSNCGSNNGSSHYLSDIQALLTNKGSAWNFSNTAADNNPCSGCHNPHRAQSDPHTVTGRIGADGKLVSSISKPNQHSKDNNVWQLWGDDTNERMNNYTTYQASYRYNSTTTYEPDGYNTSDPTRTVDVVAFCLRCHKDQVYSTYRGNLNAIDWTTSNTADIHGAGTQGSCKCDLGDKKLPYPVDTYGYPPYTYPTIPYPNYVLSCLDCHEPHGSPNEYLLREEVNGTHVGAFQPKAWYNFCAACHKNLRDYPNPGDPGKHMCLVPYVPSCPTGAIGPTNGCGSTTSCHGHGNYTTSPNFTQRCLQSDGFECGPTITIKIF
jgi:predicted CXXCH cytochrome family protein